MNPESQPVRPNVEVAPQIPGATEYFPGGPKSPEQGQTSLERPSPAPVEQLTQSAQLVAPALPVPVVDTGASAVTMASDDDTPATAGDDDLIEKEWVDKVKKIIVLTRGNPYEQAKAIANLQADYLKKRYNRVIGEGGGQ